MPFPVSPEIPTPRLGLAYAGAQRIDTGFLPTIPATGAFSMGCWAKIASGAGASVLIGSGKVPAAFNRCQIDLQATGKMRVYAKDDATRQAFELVFADQEMARPIGGRSVASWDERTVGSRVEPPPSPAATGRAATSIAPGQARASRSRG